VFFGENADLTTAPYPDKNFISYLPNNSGSTDSNGYPYGKLYDATYVAANPSVVCPAGYHLPSNDDFLLL